MNKYHQMIRGGLYVIMLQVVGGAIVFFVIYHNYQSITRSSSIQEHYSQTFSFEKKAKKAHGVAPLTPDTNTGAKAQAYSGAFGVVEIGERKIGTEYNNKNINYEYIQIDTSFHDSALYSIEAFENNIIDGPTARYLMTLSHNISTFEQTINDLNFLTKYTSKSPITSPKESIRNKLDGILQGQDKQEKFKNLVGYFLGLETEIKDIFASKRTTPRKNKLIASEQFAYIYNMVHIDTLGMYKEHIDLASNIFGIKPNLVKVCIMVEQLRAFYTFKGLFKSIAHTNKYLTVMSQQSFGIGGIKLATAEKLEQWLQQENPDIYNKYFSYTNTKSVNQQRVARLTDTKNYHYQILYTAGILYWYKSERSKAGYDIGEKPGILATMYNIGYSKPHPGADIGGASLKIEGDSYSFGGLAMLIYYYLEIFG